MRIKLSIKLFGAFFLILAIVVGAMIFSRYLFERNFENYIQQMELQRLQRLVPALQAAYRVHHNWTDIKNDATHWDKIIRDMRDIGRHEPPPPRDQGPPGGPPRILLMDANRQPVFGMPGPGDQIQLIPIHVDEHIVGWLGLKRHPPYKSGPPADLFQRQARQFYLLGGGVIALTALIAFLFSRHLLNPIRRLILGTRQLAGRDFSARITPTTSDELSQLASHFNAMASTLEDFEKLRRQWLTDISHELRTPLSVLRGEIEAIQDGVRQPTPDNLASLHVEILRISRLVEDLHLLSIAESDKIFLNRDPFSLSDLLETLVQEYQTRFSESNIRLTCQLDAITGTIIKGDADRLSQVFTNVLDNALKYVQAPGSLEITGQPEAQDVALYFQDSGPGVPPESLPRLFDRLYRVDPSRNRDTGGSGLGLSICRQIIEKHGGRIWAQPSPPGGLCIGIKIPM